MHKDAMHKDAMGLFDKTFTVIATPPTEIGFKMFHCNVNSQLTRQVMRIKHILFLTQIISVLSNFSSLKLREMHGEKKETFNLVMRDSRVKRKLEV